MVTPLPDPPHEHICGHNYNTRRRSHKSHYRGARPMNYVKSHFQAKKKSQRGASCLPEITRFLPVANTIFFSSLSNKQTIDWVVERHRAVGFIHWRMRKKNAHYISNAKQSKLVTIKIMRRVQKSNLHFRSFYWKC